MKPIIRWFVSVGWMLAATSFSLAGDVKVIANPSVKSDSISETELRSVYLLQRRTLNDGSAVQPVLGRGIAHIVFLRDHLKRDNQELHTYYEGMVFTGKSSMPKQLNSDAEVVAYVARNRGAIGYVSEPTDTTGTKVLTVVAEDSKQERELLSRVEPEYPETLRRMGIGGIVKLELTISPKGAVEQLNIVGGNPILAEAAVTAVKQWVYSPSSSSTKMQVTIPFHSKP